MGMLFGTETSMAKPSSPVSGHCLPPQAGHALSVILEKPETLSLLPRGWHLGDAEVRQRKILIHFHGENSSTSAVVELIQKKSSADLSCGKWFCFNVQNRTQETIPEKDRKKFLIIAEHIDRSFLSNPFIRCFNTWTNEKLANEKFAESHEQAKEIVFPRGLFLLLGGLWLVLILGATVSVFKMAPTRPSSKSEK